MSILDDMLGGGAAKEAGEIQQQYGAKALEEYRRMFGLSQLTLSPYNQGGLWALEQLIGTSGMQTPVSPGTQAQVDAWNAWQSSGVDATKAPGYIGGKLGWDTWDDKEKFIEKNKDALQAMLPTGMSVKDVPHWERWIMNPYPVDQWGNPLPENLWKYPSEQPTGATAEGGVTQGQGLLLNPPPSFGEGLATYQDSPWYQQQFNEGIKALESSQAGKGLLQSGSTGKALTQWGQDYGYSKAMDVHQQNVSDWITTQLNPLLSVLGLGQVAGQQMAGNALTAAKDTAQNQMYQGEAKASGYLGQAAARQNALGGVMNLAGTLGGAAIGGLTGGILPSGSAGGSALSGTGSGDWGFAAGYQNPLPASMFPALNW